MALGLWGEREEWEARLALIYRGEEVVSKEVEILIANLIFTLAEIYLHSSWVGWSARELKTSAALLDLKSGGEEEDDFRSHLIDMMRIDPEEEKKLESQ